MARIVDAGLSEALDQPVVIDNRPVTSSSAAAALIVHSPPDGHSMRLVATSIMAVNLETIPQSNTA